MAGTRYEHASSERISGGVRLQGTQHHAFQETRDVTATVADDRRSVVVRSGNIEFILPAADARVIASEMLAAADVVERSEAPAAGTSWMGA